MEPAFGNLGGGPPRVYIDEMLLAVGESDADLGSAFYCEMVRCRLRLRGHDTHAVTDTGYWFESWFNFYLPGEALGLDGSAWYVKRQWITMRWPYDERARMIGERVYDHPDITQVHPIDESDVITSVEAKERLEPLIRPLPAEKP